MAARRWFSLRLDQEDKGQFPSEVVDGGRSILPRIKVLTQPKEPAYILCRPLFNIRMEQQDNSWLGMGASLSLQEELAWAKY